MPTKKDKATLFLTTDMLENILSRASTPGECADYITEQMRQLAAAKIVALVQTPLTEGPKELSIISVYPARYREKILTPTSKQSMNSAWEPTGSQSLIRIPTGMRGPGRWMPWASGNHLSCH